MSSIRLDSLIDEFPEESEAISRLAGLLEPTTDRPALREYTSARLYDLLRPTNHRVLVQLLSSAAEKGLVKKVVRVVSAAKGGIGDFDSIVEIPAILFDSRIGVEVEVTLDNITLIYQVSSMTH